MNKVWQAQLYHGIDESNCFPTAQTAVGWFAVLDGRHLSVFAAPPDKRSVRVGGVRGVTAKGKTAGQRMVESADSGLSQACPVSTDLFSDAPGSLGTMRRRAAAFAPVVRPFPEKQCLCAHRCVTSFKTCTAGSRRSFTQRMEWLGRCEMESGYCMTK